MNLKTQSDISELPDRDQLRNIINHSRWVDQNTQYSLADLMFSKADVFWKIKQKSTNLGLEELYDSSESLFTGWQDIELESPMFDDNFIDSSFCQNFLNELYFLMKKWCSKLSIEKTWSESWNVSSIKFSDKYDYIQGIRSDYNPWELFDVRTTSEFTRSESSFKEKVYGTILELLGNEKHIKVAQEFIKQIRDAWFQVVLSKKLSSDLEAQSEWQTDKGDHLLWTGKENIDVSFSYTNRTKGIPKNYVI